MDLVVHWSVFVRMCVCVVVVVLEGGHKQFWIVRYSTLMNETDKSERNAWITFFFFPPLQVDGIESIISKLLLYKLQLGVSHLRVI